MKIYRLSFHGADGGHDGYEYHAAKKKAAQSAKEAENNGFTASLEEIDVPITVAGFLMFADRYASHPDNG